MFPVRLDPGRHVELDIPAWSASVVVVHRGFCLSGTDGESPDIHAGEAAIYRRRSKTSPMILVAGPDGCQATLVVAAGSAQAKP